MPHKKFMQAAILEAQKSGKEIPVGAVLVKENQIIAKAHNEKESLNDITAHAEILVLKAGAKLLNNWRLEGCTLYVTLEPCPMCATAIINSRIDTLYFGAYDMLYGSMGSVLDLRKIFNSKLKTKGGILEQECEILLKNFWRKNEQIKKNSR